MIGGKPFDRFGDARVLQFLSQQESWGYGDGGIAATNCDTLAERHS